MGEGPGDDMAIVVDQIHRQAASAPLQYDPAPMRVVRGQREERSSTKICVTIVLISLFTPCTGELGELTCPKFLVKNWSQMRS